MVASRAKSALPQYLSRRATWGATRNSSRAWRRSSGSHTLSTLRVRRRRSITRAASRSQVPLARVGSRSKTGLWRYSISPRTVRHILVSLPSSLRAIMASVSVLEQWV